jgi:hypothetical protein
MCRFRSLAFAFLAVSAGPASAWTFHVPDSRAAPPTQHQIELRYTDSRPQPYAMNYADEAARKLGIQDGKWEVFDTRSSDPLMPSLKGGIDGGRAMIGLQWRPGQ